jgi:hypothetical protein
MPSDAINNVNDYYLKVQALSTVPDSQFVTDSAVTTIPLNFTSLVVLSIGFVCLLIIGIGFLFSLRTKDFHAFSNGLKLAFLLAVIPIGYALLSGETRLGTKASPFDIPSEVMVTNVTNTSFTLSWSTSTANRGMVRYSLDPAMSDAVISIANKQPETLHQVTITKLKPNTPYFVEVFSSSRWYNDSGLPLRIKTIP